jgi:hypothetical protein
LKFIIENKEYVVRAGEVLVIPSHTPHSAEALEDTIDLDIFCPPRRLDQWNGRLSAEVISAANNDQPLLPLIPGRSMQVRVLRIAATAAKP